jgi:hypothetical protein
LRSEAARRLFASAMRFSCASGLAGAAGRATERAKKSDTHHDFFFLQLSDTH